MKRLQIFLKVVFDKLFAQIALIFLFPILAVISLAIYIQMGFPVLFLQSRPGKDNKVFTFYKFRTMTNDCDSDGNLCTDERRLTGFGHWLRRTSLDELPQLWNIVKGDMSFVGPRPLLVKYLDRYTPEQARRHHVKPGITGWAQVNGRNLLEWEEKFKLDLWYVDHWNLLIDLRILLLTISKVFNREGISHPKHMTMSEFKSDSLSEDTKL